MRVFVTGATGALGRYLVPGLVAAGYEVTATTRTPGKAARLREAGAEPVVVDGLDREAVVAAVRAASPGVIVHEMTALAGMRSLRHPDKAFAVTNELRTRGTDNLLAAAARAGTRRVIAQSYAGAAPDKRSGGALKTEADPPDLRPVRSAVQGPAAIAYVDKTVPLAAPEGIVLRYGSLYGPGASDFLVDMVRKRQVPVIGGGTGVWSFIEVTDAAAATVAAVGRGAPGLYNVVDDDPAPVAEWLPYLAQVAGAKPPSPLETRVSSGRSWLTRSTAAEISRSNHPCRSACRLLSRDQSRAMTPGQREMASLDRHVQGSRPSSQSNAAVQKTMGAMPSQWPSAPSALVNRRNSLGQVSRSNSTLPWPTETVSVSLSVTKLGQVIAEAVSSLV